MNQQPLNFTPGGGAMGGQPMGGQQPQALNLDVNTLSNFRCPHCQNQVFQPLFIAKKVSGLQSPTGKDGVAPMQIFACTNCGAVPAEFGGNLLEKDAQATAPPEPNPDADAKTDNSDGDAKSK